MKPNRHQLLVASLAPFEKEIRYYASIMGELNRTYRDTVIACFINDGDDKVGARFVKLMVPVKVETQSSLLIGLAERASIEQSLTESNTGIAKILADMDEVAIIAAGFGSIGVFSLAGRN